MAKKECINDKTLEQKCREVEAEKLKRLSERTVYSTAYSFRGLTVFVDEKGLYNLGTEVMQDNKNKRIIVELHVLDYMKRHNLVDERGVKNG